MNPSDRFLRLALRANASFSIACALAAGLGLDTLASALGISEPVLLPTLALNLLVFAGFLVWLSLRDAVAAALAWGVVAADGLWVVGTVPLVASDQLNATGDAVAIAVAAFVSLWAVLQALGIRRMTVAPEPA